MREKCGIAAVKNLADSYENVTPYAVGLAEELQHRGELGAGIAWERQNIIHLLKGNGLAKDVLCNARTDPWFSSSTAIAHTRYATSGSTLADLAQPFHYSNVDAHRRFAFGFNGNIANYADLAHGLRENGSFLDQNVDTALIGSLIVEGLRERKREEMRDVIGALEEKLDGAFNLIIMNGEGDVFAYRDRHGFRPLAFAEHNGMITVASENSAIRKVCGEITTHHLNPGQLLTVRTGEYSPLLEQLHEPLPARCFFEWTYFSRRLTSIDGKAVQNARYLWGEMLGRMDSTMSEQHVVVPVPDSAKVAAEGYADYRRLARVDAIRKNLDIGRTFITAEDREKKAERKYEIAPNLIRGKDIILIDDSLVRGTTMKILVRRLREIGSPAKIHLRLASPPIVSPCFYGIDFPTIRELLARKYSDGSLQNDGTLPVEVLDAIACDLGVDSIKYLPLPAVSDALGMPMSQLCTACVSKDYPTPMGTMLAAEIEHTTLMQEPPMPQI